MTCRVSAKFQLGGWTVALDAEVELAPVTLFVGPNASGKSLTLCSIARALGGPAELECPETAARCTEERGHVFFLDAYRSVAKFAEIGTETSGGFALKPRGLKALLSMRRLADPKLLAEAEAAVEEELARMERAIREMGLKADAADLLPIELAVDGGEIRWRDRAGPSGAGLRQLPAGLSAAMVAAGLKYAHAATGERPVYLFVEEPEAHAGPLQAFFLGHLAAVLTKRAEERGAKLFFVASTHNIDFIRGATRKWTKIYLMSREVRRDAREIDLRTSLVESMEWIPHFPEVAILATVEDEK